MAPPLGDHCCTASSLAPISAYSSDLGSGVGAACSPTTPESDCARGLLLFLLLLLLMRPNSDGTDMIRPREAGVGTFDDEDDGVFFDASDPNHDMRQGGLCSDSVAPASASAAVAGVASSLADATGTTAASLPLLAVVVMMAGLRG